MEPLQGTKSGKDSIGRVKYTHDAMIDVILLNPKITQNEIAEHFGFTKGWISRVMGSDAFQARLAARKDEVVTPCVLASMGEKFQSLAFQSFEILEQKLEATQSADMALKTLELSSKALGMGARPQNVQQNNTYVVALPEKSTNETEWAQEASREIRKLATPRPQVVDVEVKVVE